ncbi:hypothetical protein HOE425_240025 [Hoeflea sp. EC-HK425]|nr:hypothetical protein HOE425_240025 [Hoeflea sp. EC-HK425]
MLLKSKTKYFMPTPKKYDSYNNMYFTASQLINYVFKEQLSCIEPIKLLGIKVLECNINSCYTKSDPSGRLCAPVVLSWTPLKTSPTLR